MSTTRKSPGQVLEDNLTMTNEGLMACGYDSDRAASAVIADFCQRVRERVDSIQLDPERDAGYYPDCIADALNELAKEHEK